MVQATKSRSYVYLAPACINIDGRRLALHNGDLNLSRAARAMVHAVLGGLGRTDALARAACQENDTPAKWEREFLRAIAGSPILAVEELPADLWPERAPLVCDWNGCLPGLSGQSPLMHWRRPPKKGRTRAFRIGGSESLFVQAQLMRALLGSHHRGRIVLASATDLVLFGDLAYRHESLVCVAMTWPEARRVWQADGQVLREDPRSLEELFYALRHVNDQHAGDLSAVAGTMLASQEVRALCDARMVLCWTEAQEAELLRFYGRSKDNVRRVLNEVNIRSMTEVDAQRAMVKAVKSWLASRQKE